MPPVPYHRINNCKYDENIFRRGEQKMTAMEMGMKILKTKMMINEGKLDALSSINHSLFFFEKAHCNTCEPENMKKSVYKV